MAEGVALWSADPAALAALDPGPLLALLDANERKRHARLRFEEDARAYLLAHALRRLALARRLRCAPQAIVFEADARGAERIARPAAPDLHVSLSRSRRGIAFALAQGVQVGVDIETLDPARADFELLTPWLRWEAAQPERHPLAFFEHWTALEAFCKALGTGLDAGNPLLRCEPGEGEIVLRFAGGEHAVAGRARLLDAGPHCALALATRGAAPVAARHHRMTDAPAWSRLLQAHGQPASVP